MALIKCKDCGKEMSNTAFRCPYCGCTAMYQDINKKTLIKILLIAGIILLIGFLYFKAIY